MKSLYSNSSKTSCRQISGHASERRPGNRGVALIITLILLLLLSAASIAIVLLVSSDTMINGFYRNYRGSFYAADSGVNVVVESMKNALLSAGNGAGNPPFASGAVPASVTTAYTAFQGGNYTFGDTNSWNGKFQLITNPGSTAVIGTANVTSVANPNDPRNPADLLWTYTYPYTVTIRGESNGTEGEEITETGWLTYSSAPGAPGAGGPPSFSDFGAFITNFTPCQGALVPGTMSGPFFTDGQWNFGNFSSPGYTFTGSIAQAGSQASWINGGNCTNSATPPSGFRVPSFPSGGLQLNATPVTPPTDSWSQAEAVIDAKGAAPCTVAPCSTTTTPPTQAQFSAVLQTIGGTSYPATGSVPNGVYIPYYTGHGCATKCFGSFNTSTSTAAPAGGFFVQGNASIKLIASTGGDSTSNLTQTYQITQGGTTTTIVVDNVNNTTTVNGVTITGVPAQLNPTTGLSMTETDPSGNVVNPTLIFVNGAITGLTGTYGSGNSIIPAIQDATGVTIAASSDISITGDITYAHLPVNLSTDASVANANSGVLGVYTNGNINLSPGPSGNLTVDASLAAIGGSSGNAGFETQDSSGNPTSIGTWTIVGGRSEDHAHGVNISTGNTVFDTRFGPHFGPPWFPTGVPTATSIPVAATPPQVVVTRGAWAEVNRNGNGNY
jgi:Tfp pilus assembly protein PilX